MKKLFFGLVATILTFGLMHAQTDGKKELKEAKKVMNAFNLDQMNKRATLGEAVTNIEAAVKGSEAANDIDFWMTRGDIYNAISNQFVTIRSTSFGDENELPKVENPAMLAMESYVKALGMATKKFETKTILKSLQEVQGNLSNFGIYKYDEQNYNAAYASFNGVLECHKLLKDNGEASSLDDPENFKYQHYLAGLAALNGEDMGNAAAHFNYLYDQNYDKPAIYEALYKINAEQDAEAAYKYLEKARSLYPDDISLLFAEINHFLKLQKLDVLITKLKAAIEKEPNNVSVYSTLGNVYDQLYQREYEAGNAEKAQEHFDGALDYYKQALKIKEDNFDATYSIGALYYNKAAIMAKELNDITDNKLYEKKRVELLEQFGQALPYFQAAEKIDPNDANTLIALKEIYAKQDNFDVSTEFKNRLEKVQAGGSNESYFKKN